MFVKNNCARLISINDGKKVFDIIPGINAVVEISESAAGLAFTKNLLKSGDLIEVAEPQKTEKENSDNLDRAAIIEQLEELGVEFNKSAQVKTLKKLLDESLEG